MAKTTDGRPRKAWLAALSLSLTLVLAACGFEEEAVTLDPAPAPLSAPVPVPAASPSLAIAPARDTFAAGSHGDARDESGGTPFAAVALKPAPESVPATLAPGPVEILDSTRTGPRLVKAVGALDDGGHAVVWMSHEPADSGAAWPLWVQRFDAQGRKAGGVVRLDYPDVNAPHDVAVTVLPEGRIGVTFLTIRVEDPAFAITQVHHWPFDLGGSISGAVRVLDTERFARFSPRFARLAGPLTAAVGRDGSQFVAWRYQIVGAAPLAPSVRAQRLAADGEPLDWIQRLDGEGSFSRVQEVRLSPLDEGGWVVAMERINAEGLRVANFVQLDLARPLELPQGPLYGAGSFLLDLRGHGSVLFANPLAPDTGEALAPWRLHFTARGRAQEPMPLASLPVAAVALRGGDYLAFDFEAEGSRLSARRYTPTGRPVGPALSTGATSGLLAAGLRRGGAALAWVASTPDGEVRVLSQRLAP